MIAFYGCLWLWTLRHFESWFREIGQIDLQARGIDLDLEAKDSQAEASVIAAVRESVFTR
jgi:hypothetical protein